MQKSRAQRHHRLNRAAAIFPAVLLGGLVTLTGCTPQPAVPGGGAATLNVKIDSTLGDAGVVAGPLPAVFNGFKQQSEVASKFQEQGEVDTKIQIPADQDDIFVFNEIFANHRFKCSVKFGLRPSPNQTYLVIVGDIPPTPKASDALGEIAHVLAAGDVPRCYVHRFNILPDGSLQPAPFNDQTFEPSVIP